MAFCEKCGAQIAENIKFCDKCGAPVAAPAEQPTPAAAPNYAQPQQTYQQPQQTYQQANQDYQQPQQPYGYTAAPKKSLVDTVKGILPAQLTTPGDKTLYWIGLGTIAAIAITYIVCMFAFMADMCYPIGVGCDFDMIDFWDARDNANPIWMIIFMAISIAPAVFAVMSFRNKKWTLYTVFAAAAVFVLTIFGLIVWGIMDFTDITSENAVAWYVLVDFLSEAWYLKLILPLGTIFGFGVDYLVNKEN